MTPAIVVIAYNRPRSLQRLLSSLAGAKYPDGVSVPLVISIDAHPDNRDVLRIAEEYAWQAGPKVVRYQEKNLGLRRHVLCCGDLTSQYGSIILLEDDLTVSPFYYEYAAKALDYYRDDPVVAGISLYLQRLNETAMRPFEALDDGSDVFFLQLASSWGQAWSKDQWEQFKAWYDGNSENPVTRTDRLPANVVSWPASSWKKYFIKYMVATDRYFVYPRSSLSTNFGDVGTHYAKSTHLLQTSMLLGQKEFRFRPLQESLSIYDAFHELRPDCIKVLNPSLVPYEFDVDLYGTKCIASARRDFVLTARDASESSISFARARRPHEAGIIFGDSGADFHLSRWSALRDGRWAKLLRIVRDYRYDMPFASPKRNMVMAVMSWLEGVIGRVR